MRGEARRPLVLLGAFILVLLAANVTWILRDTSPPLWDIAGHSARAARYAGFIEHGQIRSMLTYPTIYPPAAYLLAGLGFVIFGRTADVPQFSLLLSLVLFLLSVYGLTWEWTHRRSTALLATFLATIPPLMAHFSRIYDLDFPLTALVTASVYVLVRSRRFRNRPWAIAFGILAAMGLLTKWTYGLFIIGPLIAYLWTQPERPRFPWNVWKIMLVSLTIAAGIAMPWYALHGIEVLTSSVETRFNGFSVPVENLMSLANVLYYPGQIVHGMTWLLALLGLAGIVTAFIRRRTHDKMLLGWILLPYLLMTFLIYSKESRYVLPLYPALAILGAMALTALRWRRVRTGLVVAIVVVGTFVWWETSWGFRTLPPPVYRALGFSNAYGYFEPTYRSVGYGFPEPTQFHANLPEISKAILADKRTLGTENAVSRIVVVPNSIFLTSQQVEFTGNLIGLRADYALSSLVRSPAYKTFLHQADYIVTKTGDQGPSVWAPKPLRQIRALETRDRSLFTEEFERIGTWTVAGIERTPQEIRLYRKKTSSLTKDAADSTVAVLP